jgi:penicillin-binding protein 2
MDRKGRAITGRREPCVVLIPAMLGDIPALAARLSELLSLDEQLAFSRLQAVQRQMLAPAVFKTGLSLSEATALRAARLPGVLVISLAARYGREGVAAHMVGQVQVGEKAGLMIGVSGLELQYQAELAGRVDDKIVAWVDAKGRLSGPEWQVAKPERRLRHDVWLTVDVDYQQIAERALAGQQGACVILEPHSGDILAAASTPGFDPYGWQPPPGADALLNKAFTAYPPASTFKILLALAAAEQGLPPLMADFCCDGSALIGENHNINCWNRLGHGSLSLPQALAVSCNCYFAALGWELGGHTLRAYLARCGLERQRVIGYEVPAAASLSFNASVAGDVANVSIGENGVRLSPLQVAQLAAICANGGYALSPRLLQGLRDQDGILLQEVAPQAPQRAVKESAALAVADMMRLAVLQGTLKSLQNTLLPMAAKSGTSEAGGVWCAGFAPYRAKDPAAARWAIAVYIANGRSGAQEAAVVMKKVVDDIALLEGLAGYE